MSLNFCFIGAGNLATHLSTALNEKAGKVIQVYSRTEESARTLAQKLNSPYTTSTKEITDKADIYFIALKDAVVADVLSEIDFQNKLVVHCSGSLHMAVLNDFSSNYGVLYPLQTFSRMRRVDFAQIPVFIEANNSGNLKILTTLAHKISESVTEMDSARRKSLHIAAVFSNNFVNHFYTLAADFLEAQNIPFEVLHPLILETAKKAQEMNPKDAQTGPAVRFDETIINDHLHVLEKYPEKQALYNLISRSIFEHHQKK
ncbi:DUF2520 domain-containing protein [Maribellus sp. YY47]|uniref:Rossmann-like and DUF2520 domain-containing protein n=1 Tax=Maribellus sp. YY47 TaxID=2929486 RepID=UPI0020013FBF|nr:DUF2520 domain-containing protein [Maribellus sp. YY47]MCK3685674.1 DUF2520 domain-containing protein [Maribellus sp. YY47]